MRIRCLFLSLLLLAVFFGCKQEQRPEGLPDLYPFSVRIVQDGTPLPDANVTLITDDSKLMRWPCGGNTDANGVAKLNTYGFDGAPAGKFRVTVSKSESTGGPQNSEEAVKLMQEGSAVETQVFDLVDPIYKNQDQTPLTVEVSADPKGGTAEFDVGAATRELIKMR